MRKGLGLASPPLVIPRAPQDSTVAVADVRLRSVPIDTTPGAYAPPIIVTARSLPDAELEFGFAVQRHLSPRILGVATW